jgi:hypothetical protein
MIFINTQSPKAMFSYSGGKAIAQDYKINTQGNKDLEEALSKSPAWSEVKAEKKEVKKPEVKAEPKTTAKTEGK